MFFLRFYKLNSKDKRTHLHAQTDARYILYAKRRENERQKIAIKLKRFFNPRM